MQGFYSLLLLATLLAHNARALTGEHVCKKDRIQEAVDGLLDLLGSSSEQPENVLEDNSEDICCQGYQEAPEGGYCVATCAPQCANGGTCAEPNTCVCAPEFTGDTCQDKTDVVEDEVVVECAAGSAQTTCCLREENGGANWTFAAELCAQDGGRLAFVLANRESKEPEWEVDLEATEEPFIQMICPEPFVGVGEDGCYFFGEEAVTWSEAGERCLDMEAYLLTVETPQEKNMLQDAINQLDEGSFYSGGHLSGSQWTWIADSEPMGSLEWASDEASDEAPSSGPASSPAEGARQELCAVLSRDEEGRVQWRARDCTQPLPFICEVSAVFQGFQHRQARKYRKECPPSFLRLGPGCYHFGNDSVNWWRALEACARRGAFLFVADSEQENDYVRKHLLRGKLGSHWLGAYDLGHPSEFFWDYWHTPVQVSDWARGQPEQAEEEQHCAAFDSALRFNYQWKARNCMDQLPYVCKVWN